VADELHYDVLIVGAGSAAMSAALAALEQGARVGILEKAPRLERGGNSTLTGHMRFAYNSVDDLAALMRDPSPHDLAHMADELPRRTEAELCDELMRVTADQSDQQMLQIHVSESYRTVRWLASKGHDWVPYFANRTTGNIVAMNGGGYGLRCPAVWQLDHLPCVTPGHRSTGAPHAQLDGERQWQRVESLHVSVLDHGQFGGRTLY
jgi:tricarballylate dehydrogenase